MANRTALNYLRNTYLELSEEKLARAMLTEWMQDKGIHFFEEVDQGKRRLKERFSL